MVTDEQLVEEALAGSASAFAEIVDRYAERLLRFLLIRCETYADAEDALQDTFANAYRYLDSFNAKWRFSTWLYRIAMRNAARMTHKERLECSAIEPADERADPLSECIRQSERENLWLTAKRLLPGDAYSALWLRCVEDLSLKDVASVLDRSMSWTKVTLMRSRNALQQELGGQLSGERQEYG